MSDSPAAILYDASGNPVSIDASGRIMVNGSGVVQPVSASALPLPSGAATDAGLANIISALATKATEATLATLLTQAGFQARINTLGQKLMAASTPVVLASDQTAVPITTSGAGEEATFTALASAVVLGNNKSMLGLFNPVGSGYTIKLREIYLRNSQTSAVTGVATSMQLHAIRGVLPGILAGTTVTPVAHDSNDALPAGLVCVTGGTVTGETAEPLDVMRISSDEWGPGTLDVEGHHHGFENYMPARVKRDSVMKPFLCRPGQGIHIKCATNTTAGSFDIILIFTKV